MTNELATLDKEYADLAAQYAAQHPLGGGQFVSIKGGMLMYDDEELPGNQMAVIVLDSVLENTYYPEKYVEGSKAPPRCYAFGRRADEMGPHPSMQAHPEYFSAQWEQCQGCPHNQWASADKGTGKACSNRARLAFLQAGEYRPVRKGSNDYDLHLFDDPKYFEQADIYRIKIPPTSVKSEWAKYVAQLAITHRRPPFTFITRVWLVPHPKHQVHVKFAALEPVPDALAQIVFKRHQEAARSIVTAYTPPEAREQPQQGLRGLRR